MGFLGSKKKCEDWERGPFSEDEVEDPNYETCPTCGGNDKNCKTCNGKGKVLKKKWVVPD